MAREIKINENYMGRLLKLIPTEIIGAYLAIQGMVPVNSQKWGLSIASIVLLVITPFYLKRVQKVEKTSQVIVSTFGFIIWLYTLGGPFTLWDIYEPWISSVVLLLWTMFIPRFFNVNGNGKKRKQ
jgi:uncharacterized membrane protein (UPF0136 family)